MPDLHVITTTISVLLLVIAVARLAIFFSLSVRHHSHRKRHHPKKFENLPLVSVIIPSFNEEPTLKNCVQSILEQIYGYYEIIIVDDGSTDNTLKIAHKFARQHPNIHVHSKQNGGKASALNYGLEKAQGSIIVSIDADSTLLKTALRQIVLTFEDPTVMAMGGNVRVANRGNILGHHQALEYVTGLTLQRSAFAHLGCMQVISGAIGAFRKDKLLEVGGYSNDTIVEDMDITIEFARRGFKVVYNPLAIAYTEAPESVSDFLKQRYRWVYGSFQVIEKHRDLLFKRSFRRMGFIGMPYFVIFPWIDVLVSLLLLAAIIRIAVTHDGIEALFFFLGMAFLNALVVAYVLITDKEHKRLILLVGLDNLFYNHLLSFTTLRAGIHYIMRRKAHWNKLKRYGKNIAPKEVVSS